MKTIQLKKRSIFEDKNVLKEIISNHKTDGVKISEIRILVRILDKLESEKDLLDLEDSEYALLVKYFENFDFGIAHPDICGLYDSIIKCNGCENSQ